MNRTLWAFLLLLSLTTPSGADETGWPPALLERLENLRQAALDSNYALDQVDVLCNVIGHRLSGSRQAEAAVAYVAQEMEGLGFKVQLEEVKVPHWVRGQERGRLTEYPGRPEGLDQELALTTLGNSVATPPEGLEAEIVVVGSMQELESLPKERVEGRIVLFNTTFDEEMAGQGEAGRAYGEASRYRVHGPSKAAEKGAVAALVNSAGGGDYRLPHTGVTVYQEATPGIPAAALAHEDTRLIARLAERGPVKAYLLLTPQRLPDAVSHNVIADLQGSERPEEVVLVSGHLDSWDVGTGALDDASGVGMAMAALKLVKQLGFKPRRTLRLVAFMNEENGGRGSKTYAANHSSDKHFAALESDLGADHPVGFWVTGEPDLLRLLQPVSEVLTGAGILRLSPYSGADIEPLAEAGVPCLSPEQDSRRYFFYHHTGADTFDKINPRWLAENTALMAVMAYALADYPGELPRASRPPVRLP